MAFDMLPGVQFPAEARGFAFLTIERTGCGTHLASYSVGIEVVLRRDYSRSYVKLTNDVHIWPSWKMIGTRVLRPLYAFMMCKGTNLHSYFTLDCDSLPSKI